MKVLSKLFYWFENVCALHFTKRKLDPKNRHYYCEECVEACVKSRARKIVLLNSRYTGKVKECSCSTR